MKILIWYMLFRAFFTLDKSLLCWICENTISPFARVFEQIWQILIMWLQLLVWLCMNFFPVLFLPFDILLLWFNPWRPHKLDYDCAIPRNSSKNMLHLLLAKKKSVKILGVQLKRIVHFLHKALYKWDRNPNEKSCFPFFPYWVINFVLHKRLEIDRVIAKCYLTKGNFH